MSDNACFECGRLHCPGATRFKGLCSATLASHDPLLAAQADLILVQAQLKACREELTQAIMQDSRIRGRAAAAEREINMLRAKNPNYPVPVEVMDLLEVLR